MKKIIFALIGSILLLSSCNTDLDVLAPYKDIPSVYGILNQNDSIHFIRISKAFLGRQDASVMAQVPDSSQYPINALEVRIFEFDDKNNQKRIFTLKDTLITNKETGYFYSPNQLVYYFTTVANSRLNQDYSYLLEIKNKLTGQTIFSSYDDINKKPLPVQMVNSFNIINPMNNPATPIVFYSGSKQSDYTVKWTSAKDGLLYDLYMNMHYIAVNKNSNDSIRNIITWKFAKILGTDLKGTRDLEYKITPDIFYDKVLNELQSKAYFKDNFFIVLDTLNFRWDVAGEDLATFIQVADPGTSIIQERPVFSNVRAQNSDGKIEKAIGIFSTRYSQFIFERAIHINTARELKRLATDRNIDITRVRLYNNNNNPPNLHIIDI
jgi:hypothetical protein